jgi:hypothetical protein
MRRVLKKICDAATDGEQFFVAHDEHMYSDDGVEFRLARGPGSPWQKSFVFDNKLWTIDKTRLVQIGDFANPARFVNKCNGHFIALTASQMYTSDDGEEWTQLVIPSCMASIQLVAGPTFALQGLRLANLGSQFSLGSSPALPFSSNLDAKYLLPGYAFDWGNGYVSAGGWWHPSFTETTSPHAPVKISDTDITVVKRAPITEDVNGTQTQVEMVGCADGVFMYRFSGYLQSVVPFQSLDLGVAEDVSYIIPWYWRYSNNQMCFRIYVVTVSGSLIELRYVDSDLVKHVLCTGLSKRPTGYWTSDMYQTAIHELRIFGRDGLHICIDATDATSVDTEPTVTVHDTGIDMTVYGQNAGPVFNNMLSVPNNLADAVGAADGCVYGMNPTTWTTELLYQIPGVPFKLGKKTGTLTVCTNQGMGTFEVVSSNIEFSLWEPWIIDQAHQTSLMDGSACLIGPYYCTYVNDQYVLVYSDGRIYASLDLSTWTLLATSAKLFEPRTITGLQIPPYKTELNRVQEILYANGVYTLRCMSVNLDELVRPDPWLWSSDLITLHDGFHTDYPMQLPSWGNGNFLNFIPIQGHNSILLQTPYDSNQQYVSFDGQPVAVLQSATYSGQCIDKVVVSTLTVFFACPAGLWTRVRYSVDTHDCELEILYNGLATEGHPKPPDHISPTDCSLDLYDPLVSLTSIVFQITRWPSENSYCRVNLTRICRLDGSMNESSVVLPFCDAFDQYTYTITGDLWTVSSLPYRTYMTVHEIVSNVPADATGLFRLIGQALLWIQTTDGLTCSNVRRYVSSSNAFELVTNQLVTSKLIGKTLTYLAALTPINFPISDVLSLTDVVSDDAVTWYQDTVHLCRRAAKRLNDEVIRGRNAYWEFQFYGNLVFLTGSGGLVLSYDPSTHVSHSYDVGTNVDLYAGLDCTEYVNYVPIPCVILGGDNGTIARTIQLQSTWTVSNPTSERVVKLLSKLTQNMSDNGGLRNRTYRIIAVCNGGVVLSSDDRGSTWSTRETYVTEDLTDAIWSNALDMFIAVGKNSTLLTSPNGLTWTPRITGLMFDANTVTEHLGTAYVGCKGGKLLHTVDGINYSFVSVNTAADIVQLVSTLLSLTQELVGTLYSVSGPLASDLLTIGEEIARSSNVEPPDIDARLNAPPTELVTAVDGPYFKTTLTSGPMGMDTVYAIYRVYNWSDVFKRPAFKIYSSPECLLSQELSVNACEGQPSTMFNAPGNVLLFDPAVISVSDIHALVFFLAGDTFVIDKQQTVRGLYYEKIFTVHVENNSVELTNFQSGLGGGGYALAIPKNYALLPFVEEQYKTETSVKSVWIKQTDITKRYEFVSAVCRNSGVDPMFTFASELTPVTAGIYNSKPVGFNTSPMHATYGGRQSRYQLLEPTRWSIITDTTQFVNIGNTYVSYNPRVDFVPFSFYLSAESLVFNMYGAVLRLTAFEYYDDVVQHHQEWDPVLQQTIDVWSNDAHSCADLWLMHPTESADRYLIGERMDLCRNIDVHTLPGLVTMDPADGTSQYTYLRSVSANFDVLNNTWAKLLIGDYYVEQFEVLSSTLIRFVRLYFGTGSSDRYAIPAFSGQLKYVLTGKFSGEQDSALQSLYQYAPSGIEFNLDSNPDVWSQQLELPSLSTVPMKLNMRQTICNAKACLLPFNTIRIGGVEYQL